MSAAFLLDANVLSEPLRPRPDAGVVRQLAGHARRVATAATAWHELRFCAARLPPSRRRDAVDEYLATLASSSLPILPYDERAAEWHARERARLTAAGRTPSFADGQIAAVAHVHGLVVVTRNVHDFRPFESVRVENWFEADA